MKKIILSLLLLAAIGSLMSQEIKFTEASELNLIGKPFPNTPNPYHRFSKDSRRPKTIRFDVR